jgi:exodeoxyribonuclease-3
MRLVSWNVNGLRAVLGRTLPDWIRAGKPDVICLQETKAEAANVPDMAWAKGYLPYWYSADKKGYSGTLLLSRQQPLAVSLGLGHKAHDTEGRVITAEYPDYYVVNVYTPNSKMDLSRLEYRTQTWDTLFLKHLQKLEKKKPVISCGDFNVAHREIDLARPKGNERNAGFTIEERRSFDRYIDAGFIDSFRHFEPGGGHYSWWSQRGGSRERNVGWRIDYFLVSPKLKSRLKKAFIEPGISGSDHCPVGIELA